MPRPSPMPTQSNPSASPLPVSHYGLSCANGTRTARIDFPGGIEVRVIGHLSEDQDAIDAVAHEIAVRGGDAIAAPYRASLAALEERYSALEAACKRLKALVPPPRPAKMLGAGTIRFDERGNVWLLSNRERGWSAWGIAFESWDELFRRWDVRITAHGVDSTGEWWTAEPNGVRVAEAA